MATEGTQVQVRDLRKDEHEEAVGVLSRGMRDNPLHVAALGDDPERRRRALVAMFTSLFRTLSTQEPIAAFEGATLVGVTGVAPPGTCSPNARQQLRMLPAMLGLGPRATVRVGRWVSQWSKHDPKEPHLHLGPLAVDAHLQGRGIGSRIMEEYCRRLDAAALLGYLETDKEENVTFYERHGFTFTGEEPVLGVPNWYMRREPR